MWVDPGVALLLLLSFVLAAYIVGLHDHSHDQPPDENGKERDD